VNGDRSYRPRSFVHQWVATGSVLIFVLAACLPKGPTVTLALMGDLMLGRGVDPKPDSFTYLMPDLSAVDLALANLESLLAPVLPTTDSAYALCALSDGGDMLSAWGFDLLSISNNHNLDCGIGSLAETRSVLQSAGITPIGPDMLPVYREVNGMQLAFLAFEDVFSPLDANAAVQAIRSARLTGALVVVSIHWGAEYQGGASDRQKSLAGQFADAGAALIWGHHPHVLQPAAWIETAQGKTLVLYSLGNALFDQGGLDDTRRSALVVVTLDADGVTSVRPVPFEIDVVNSLVVQPSDESAANILDRLFLP
jgi:gamma-polyglutamate biosynthesis protein CapA